MLFANRLHIIIVSFFLGFTITLLSVVEIKAEDPPYTHITLTMYELDGEGRIVNDLNPCVPSPFETRNGCTTPSSGQSYPFSSNPETFPIESYLLNGTQHGYLYNVTPGEVAITVSSQGNKPLACVKAQAVAARTYAYYHIQQGAIINNSNQFQVYIPYQYAQLTQAQQQRVDDAVSEVLYMTASGRTDPIRAHFGADNDEWTTDGGESYLKSIYDPINSPFVQILARKK